MKKSGEGMVVEVLVELSTRSVDKTFDYLVPLELEDKIKCGIRVLVPFGYQKLEGFVLNIKKLDFTTDYSDQLKEIIEVIDQETVLNSELLDLGKEICASTLSTLISSYQIMLPEALKARKKTKISKKMEVYISLNLELENLSFSNDCQQKIIEVVKSHGKVLKSTLTKISASSVKTLLKKGILIEEKKEAYRLKKEFILKEKYPLTKLQQEIVHQVLMRRNESVTFLLHGVTGSGKTEVYMELIEHTLLEGRSSIVLVPEISLTEQIVSRFQSRFGPDIAILHSRLSSGEKYDEWRRIERHEVRIVIGARSAIFAPLENLGMIIVDEEHTSSYKQESTPKYSAIDVSKWRSRFHSCPLILGSATPTLESYARAKKGVYQLLEMKERVNQRSLPEVTIIDLNQEQMNGKHFSKLLIQEIDSRLEKGEQTILLLNRRGYASFVSCKNCGHVEKCPNCDITFTYHKSSGMLRCHYCGYATNLSSVCSECGEEAISSLGIGTEKIEEELNYYFPNSRVLRMDLDTTSRKGSHERMIMAFKNHEYDILLGTQMIAKGLDFQEVTLVGVINADTSLNFPDFRSSELTFQLLSQVAGRSGRGEKKGQVLIQTYNPDHYAITFAKNHDYQGFYEKEMKIRHELDYPPFYYLTLIRVLSRDYELASKESQKVGSYLKRTLKNSIILGPSVASIFKVNHVYRFQLMIKYKKESDLFQVLRGLMEHYQSNQKVKIDIDFNPLHI